MILFGNSIFSIIIYAIIELICIIIFYSVLQKCNYIVSLIVFLLINLIINKFYMTISGNILLDLLSNLLIGTIIIIVYRKNIKMEDIRFFTIIGMIIDIISTFFISYFWIIIGGTFFIISIFGTLFMPYIIGIILSATIICLIRKRLITKDKELRILTYMIITFICGFVSIKAGYAFLLYESARPDNLYTEMKEINDNQSLIGLSKEEVIELLGNAYKEIDNEGRTIYEFDAGKISDRLLFGESDFYKLRIVFDENNKVKSTSIDMIV